MIKTITKRDNVTIEPFTPAKLINWGEWASRSLPGRGNWWHEVISEVLDYFKGQENVHSQVLQKTLISLLLRRGTWPANKMAGRLYAASLHKELYGELMPTVRALHHKLVKVGLMAPQPYTPQEYAIVETFIDHERDFDLAHSQIHQNRKKYALRPQTGKDEYETPQFIFMRMAMAAASNEPKDTRMLQVLSYYNQFSLAKVNPPSPNYINFGTHHHGYASCFPAGSMVATARGRIPIEDIVIGDLVLTHTNEYKPVYYTQVKPYKGKFVSLNTVATFNYELKPTEDHRIYGIKSIQSSTLISDIEKKDINKRIYLPEWIKADNLRVGDLVKLVYHNNFDNTPIYIWDIIKNIPKIAEQYELKDNKIKHIYSWRSENSKETKKYPDIENLSILDEDLFRLFGYYLAEGCVCNPKREDYNKHLIFTFNSKAIEFINDVVNILEKFGARANVSVNPNDNSTKVTCNSKPLTEMFEKLLGVGFGTKRLTDCIMSASVNLQKQLIIGLIRGDGCAIIQGYTLTLSNIELIAQIRDIALRCKLHFNVSKAITPKPMETQPRATIVFNVAGTELGEKINKDYHKCRQVREHSGLNVIYLDGVAYARVRVIRSFDNECPVYDISVRGDESFSVNGVAVHNCCLIAAEDTIDSLAIHDHIAYVMTGMSAGIGTVIHTRGPGEPVRNGAISHQGKAGYYQALGKATKANIQAGRGGACNTFFSAYDPEAMLHTNAQSQLASDDKKNRDIKFTINFNQFFAKKAAKAEPIFHFTPRTQPELWKLLHSADRQGFENLYNKIDADPNIPKTYMDARDFIIYAGLKSNEVSTLHYMFIDECNRHTPFDEPINSSNLCVAPETEILTKDGNLPIAPLVNQNVTIWNGYEWSEVTVKKTSDRAALIKVVTSRGTLECTPYHKFYLKPEGIDDTAVDIEVKASSLKAGLELKAYKDHQTGEWLSNKVLDVIDEGRFDATYCFTEPKRHLGVFNGILTGQCVEIVEPTHAYRHMTDLYSEVDNGFIRFMDKLGVERTIPHSDRVVVWRDNKQKITYAGSLRKNDTVMESQGETIVQAEGMVEVSQVLEHKPTSEVALCSLAAIPVCNINSDDEYFKAAYDSLKMIDYCIHRSTYKLPHVGYTAKMRMNAAVGMMGVSTVLARKGLKYGSKEGRAEIHRLSERHAYFVIKASLAIAKERGNAPWIHKTKWPEGWLPIDTYNRNVDELTDEPLHYDWEELRSEIIAQGGIAHSVVIAHMPTESSSKASGVPRSVMPIEEVASKRSDSSNVVDWVALDSDIYEYESAYDVETMDMIAAYAIMQKFTDQAISADLFIDRNHKQLKESDILNEFFAMVKYGIKTRYYQQTKSYTRKVEAAGVHPSIAEAAQAAGIVLPDTERPAKEAPKPPEPFEIQEVASAPTIAGLSIDFEEPEDTSRGCGSGACTI